MTTKTPTLLFEGRVWKFGDNISTDLMMPGQITMAKPGISDEEVAPYCMMANRPEGAAQVKRGDIVIAGRNFGCGSSRPAPRVLRALGIAAIVAESTSRLFFRNSVHLGFPTVICKGVTEAFEEGDICELDVARGAVTNRTNGKTLQGEALPEGSPPYQILMSGGLQNYMKEVAEKIKAGQPFHD